MAEVIIALILLAPVAMIVLGVWDSRRQRRERIIRLRGPLAPPTAWLPQAIQKAAQGGIIRWDFDIQRVGQGGSPHFRVELHSSDDDLLSVHVPDFPAGDYAATPVPVLVAMERFTIHKATGPRIFGMPASYITRRRKRLIRQLKKHARTSAEQRP